MWVIFLFDCILILLYFLCSSIHPNVFLLVPHFSFTLTFIFFLLFRYLFLPLTLSFFPVSHLCFLYSSMLIVFFLFIHISTPLIQSLFYYSIFFILSLHSYFFVVPFLSSFLFSIFIIYYFSSTLFSSNPSTSILFPFPL